MAKAKDHGFARNEAESVKAAMAIVAVGMHFPLRRALLRLYRHAYTLGFNAGQIAGVLRAMEFLDTPKVNPEGSASSGRSGSSGA